jgi:hypothetical protein
VPAESRAGAAEDCLRLRLDLDVPERLELGAHPRFARDEADHRVAGAVEGDDRTREVHQASALRVHRPIPGGEGANRGEHPAVGGEPRGVDLRIPAPQVEPVDLGKSGVVKWRERDELGPFRFEPGEVVRVVKVKRFIARDPDPAPHLGDRSVLEWRRAPGGAPGESEERVERAPLGRRPAPVVEE